MAAWATAARDEETVAAPRTRPRAVKRERRVTGGVFWIGVVAALQWHFERYTRRTGIKVSFDHPASNPRFPASLEIAAFRIIQEALTNTARHAGVDHVLVELRADPEYLRLRIEDLGHGFNPDLEPAGRSAGLTGMKERALLIGGQVTIESARDAGTRIFVVLPLRGTGSTWN